MELSRGHARGSAVSGAVSSPRLIHRPTLPMSSDPAENAGSVDATLVAARDRAVVCDLSPLALIAVTGTDATAFLQGQLSVDVDGLRPGGDGVGSGSSRRRPSDSD